jgi:hypothetical protein
LLDNENVIPDIVDRMAAFLNDILTIEGEEGDDLTTIEIRLRNEFSSDSDAVMFQSDITKPSSVIPEKCLDYASYD